MTRDTDLHIIRVWHHSWGGAQSEQSGKFQTVTPLALWPHSGHPGACSLWQDTAPFYHQLCLRATRPKASQNSLLILVQHPMKQMNKENRPPCQLRRVLHTKSLALEEPVMGHLRRKAVATACGSLCCISPRLPRSEVVFKS